MVSEVGYHLNSLSVLVSHNARDQIDSFTLGWDSNVQNF